MAKVKNIIVFDFETGSLNTQEPIPIQIAGVVIDGGNLSLIPKEEGGEFESMMNPILNHKIEKVALDKNKKTMAEINNAPSEKIVWENFVEWVNKFNFGRTKSNYDAPIPCGHNIVNFDLPIARSLCARHKITKNLFSTVDYLDTQNLSMILFMKRSKKPNGYGLDDLRDFFGITKVGAHDALKDCRDCAEIIIRYLKLFSYYADKVKFEGAMCR